MACPNCGRMSGDQHDRQVFCDECIGPQRQLKTASDDITFLAKKRDKWGQEIDEDKLEDYKEERNEAKEKLEEIRKRVKDQ